MFAKERLEMPEDPPTLAFARLAGSLLAIAAVGGCAKGAHSPALDLDASDESPPSLPDAGESTGDSSEPSIIMAAPDATGDAQESSTPDGGCDADVCDGALAAICGDGIINGTEQCDDGNTTPGDGCSAACRLEPGFACAVQSGTPNSVCHATKCGDGLKEGFEQCDDGNLIPYDGCSPTCTLEPKCNGTGGCTGVCGDGLVFPPEECDDGNTISGDGCSSTCTLETGKGYTCTNISSPPASTLAIPILYRDMLYHGTTSLPAPAPPMGGHPDFNYDPYNVGVVLGLVFSPLAADGEPVLSSVGSPQQVVTDATDFCWWYHEKGCSGAGSVNPYDKLVYLDAAGKPMTLTLTQTAVGSNVYTYSNQRFFPIDGLGWNAGTNPQLGTACDGTTGHNFSFTSELHYVFTYQASIAASATPTVFNFSGDDDVWAFINDLNVVDLGGMHNALPGSVTLNTTNAGLLGLTDGGWYSIDLFQAERHVCASTYALTLGGFVHTVTQCAFVCGDGIAAGTEQCDNGSNNVPASSNPYGRGVCTDACILAPYCGDGIVQAQFGEKCDSMPNCDANCQPKMAM